MYPEEIELPEGKNFCKGILMSGPDRCCFLGWQRVLLPDLTVEQNDRFRAVAYRVAEEMELKATSYHFGPALSDINDHPDNTFKQLAKWFERTIEKLGYDIS